MSLTRYALAVIALLPVVACAAEAESEEIIETSEATLTRKVMTRNEVVAGIKSAAARRGITNGLLIAGIANHETQLAHCVDDYYVQKCMQDPAIPRSRSCGGRSVTVGNFDPGCGQGGLGVFQIDAGTQQDTVRVHGARVVELAGNTEIAIDHVINDLKACKYLPKLYSDWDAIVWLNGVKRGTAEYESWFQCVARHYNGCREENGCNQARRANEYKVDTEALIRELGADYWGSSASVPKAPYRWACASSERADGKQYWTCNGDGNLYRCDADGDALYVACARRCWANKTTTQDECK